MNQEQTNQIKMLIDEQYTQLKQKRFKHNANILFNIIQAKHNLGCPDYHRSLYIDIKHFLKTYILASDKQDYGYDSININKIMSVINKLNDEKKLSALHTAKRYYILNGYDSDIFDNKISKQEMIIAWNNRKIFKWIRIAAGSTWKGLFFTYLFCIGIVVLILLPAPYNWMEQFHLVLKCYSENDIINYFCNAIALINGSETISPTFTPQGSIGLFVYLLIKCTIYVLIGNFVYKKIELYISDKL